MERYYRFSLIGSLILSVFMVSISLLGIAENPKSVVVFALGIALLYRGWMGINDGIPFWKKWSFYYSQLVFTGTILVITTILVTPLFQ